MNRDVLWILALIAEIVFGWWGKGRSVAEAREAQMRLDSLQFQAAIGQLRVGWEVAEAERVRDLTAELEASKDSAVADMARRLRRANARISQQTQVAVALEGRLTALADSASQADPDPTSVTGEIEDGPLSATWSYLYEPRSLLLNWGARFGVELFTLEGGDGSVAVSARATDPRVAVLVEEVRFQPAAPIVERRLSLRSALIAGLLGAVGWELVR